MAYFDFYMKKFLLTLTVMALAPTVALAQATTLPPGLQPGDTITIADMGVFSSTYAISAPSITTVAAGSWHEARGYPVGSLIIRAQDPTYSAAAIWIAVLADGTVKPVGYQAGGPKFGMHVAWFAADGTPAPTTPWGGAAVTGEGAFVAYDDYTADITTYSGWYVGPKATSTFTGFTVVWDGGGFGPGYVPPVAPQGAFVEQAEELNKGLIFDNGQWSPIQ
jgi:hypothetical protein